MALLSLFAWVCSISLVLADDRFIFPPPNGQSGAPAWTVGQLVSLIPSITSPTMKASPLKSREQVTANWSVSKSHYNLYFWPGVDTTAKGIYIVSRTH